MTRKEFAARIQKLVAGQAVPERITGATLLAWATLLAVFNKLHKVMLLIVCADSVCRTLLMSVPGVGPVVAITFKSAVDDPARIKKSKAAGALFGLTPKKYQSGETEVTGGITRVGDEMVRTALYEAANIMLSRTTRFSALKRWAMERRGTRRAKVALARKLAVVLHRMGKWFGFPLEQNSTEGSIGSPHDQGDQGTRDEAKRERSPEHMVPAAVRSRCRNDGFGEAVSWGVASL